jgi:hypothetical protein
VLSHTGEDSEEDMTTKRKLLLAALIALGGGGAWWSQRTEAEPETQASKQEGDTGFSREVVEERMRAIGYVQ